MSGWTNKKKFLAVVFVFFFLGIYLGLTHARRVGTDVESTYGKLKVLADVLSIVERNYVEPVVANDLISGAINGMLETLDPHSNYMTPEIYKEMQTETRGSFGGIGFEITIRDKVQTVVAPIEDTPASRAGIQSGDMILRINGKSTKDITLMEAVRLMRGPKGTQVTITIMRQGFTEPKDLTITRAIIPIRSVRSRMLEPGYGYLKLTQFIERTFPDMEAALRKLETRDESLRGLILGLRNNPGGLLEQAVKVADLFLDSGMIVYTEGRVEGQKMKFFVHARVPHHRPGQWGQRQCLGNRGRSAAGSRPGGGPGKPDLRQGFGPDHHPPGRRFGPPPDHSPVLYSQRPGHPGQGDYPGYPGCGWDSGRETERGTAHRAGKGPGTPPPGGEGKGGAGKSRGAGQKA